MAVSIDPGSVDVILAFGDFELDQPRFELRRCGQPIAVQPKVLSLLLVLVSKRHRSVSDDELMRLVWSHETVSGASIKRAIMGARIALNDRGQSCIRTIRGHGYQFVLPVRELGTALAARQHGPVEPLAAGSAESGEGSSPVSAASLIGRAGVLAEFDECLDRAVDGSGGCVLMVGEPGIGKTRILQELSLRAAAKGAHVVTGRCLELEGAPPLWPIQQVLREALVGKSEQLVLLASSASEAISSARIEGLFEASALACVSARFRLFDGIARLLAQAARQRPLVLLLDDLHKACQGTLRLLVFLAGQLDRERVLLVGTARLSDHRDRAAHERLGELARESSTRTIGLSGLSHSEIGRYLQVRTGAPVPLPVQLQVQEHTAGNPLLIEEIIRSLRARDELAPDAARWEELDQLGQSRGLSGASERHLATLSKPCLDMLAAASVVGREFKLGLLLQLVELPTDQVMTRLSEAIAAGVVQDLPLGVGRYRFRHALLRDALHERCGAATRTRLHARIGLAMEARGAAHGDDAELAQMAEHFRLGAAEQVENKAIRYTRCVAERALQRSAYEEAAAHFQHALELVDHGGFEPEQRMQLLLARAEALVRGAEPARAREPLLRAAALARELHATEALAQVARLLGRGAHEPRFELAVGAISLASAHEPSRASRYALAPHTCGERTKRDGMDEMIGALESRARDPAARWPSKLDRST